MILVGALITALYIHNGFVHGTETGTSESTTTDPDTDSSVEDNIAKEEFPVDVVTSMEDTITFFSFSKNFTKRLELWNKTLHNASANCFQQNFSDPDQVGLRVDIDFPVFMTKNSEILDDEFLPFDDLQPVLIRKKEKHSRVNASTQALLELLPLLLFCVSCAVLSGIVLWALDNKANPSEFRRKNFWKGISDGIWWAVVTMTTVGYGDKAPKSFPARFFATVWMIAGIILLSLFTAQVSSRLTTEELKNEDHIFGKKVGIPIGFDNEASNYVQNVLQNAIIKDYHSTSEFIKALTDGTWDSALIFHCEHSEFDNSYEVIQFLETCVVGAELFIESGEEYWSDERTTKSYDSYIKCMKARTKVATKRHKKRREHSDARNDRFCKKFLKEQVSNTLTFTWVYFKNLLGYAIPLGIVIAMILISFVIGGIWDFRQWKKRARATNPPREAGIDRLPSQQEQFVTSGKIPLELQNA